MEVSTFRDGLAFFLSFFAFSLYAVNAGVSEVLFLWRWVFRLFSSSPPCFSHGDGSCDVQRFPTLASSVLFLFSFRF